MSIGIAFPAAGRPRVGPGEQAAGKQKASAIIALPPQNHGFGMIAEIYRTNRYIFTPG
ncbi:hypothetical protein [Dactylosporangium sp. CA-092794]|uniref:hypothetical protein n=1 Tax=Dactylosporangium sp. CA-092794 TaxID=3239929 RepID=UPI003D8AB07C